MPYLECHDDRRVSPALIIDAIHELEGRVAFASQTQDQDRWMDDEDEGPVFVGEPPLTVGLMHYVAPPKIGRNDPCPCRSGKKYKKRCGK